MLGVKLKLQDRSKIRWNEVNVSKCGNVSWLKHPKMKEEFESLREPVAVISTSKSSESSK